MKLLTLSDFEHLSDIFSFEGYCQLWEQQNINLYLVFPEDADRDDCLKKNIDSVNEQLKWIENSRSEIENYLIAKDFLSLAENWASGAEEAEDEEQKCYVMEDGQKVFFPITAEDFKNSLCFSSVELSYEDDINKPSINIYLQCNPDYFAYHVIDMMIDEDKNITSASLAG